MAQCRAEARRYENHNDIEFSHRLKSPALGPSAALPPPSAPRKQESTSVCRVDSRLRAGDQGVTGLKGGPEVKRKNESKGGKFRAK
jgi:hypothetical protein